MTMERNYESQMRPFDSSFCLIVLTKKKKKNNHSRPTITHTIKVFVSNVQLRSLYFGFLIITHVQNRESPFMAFQLTFSLQGIRRQPAFGCSYFTLGVLCKLKGILARIRQPNANNPHLGETVHSYPSKHKHLLLTHSKQTWPMRPVTSPEHTAFKISFFIITDSLPMARKPPLNFLWGNGTGLGQ